MLHHDALILIGEMDKDKQKHLVELVSESREMQNPSQFLRKIVSYGRTHSWMWNKLPRGRDLMGISLEQVVTMMELGANKKHGAAVQRLCDDQDKRLNELQYLISNMHKEK